MNRRLASRLAQGLAEQCLCLTQLALATRIRLRQASTFLLASENPERRELRPMPTEA